MKYKATFKLNSKAISINKCFYKNRQYTQEARQWRFEIWTQLMSERHQTEIAMLREAFDPTIHCLTVNMCFEYPRNKLITNMGNISNRAFDLSNVEKMLLDQFCQNRYNGRETSCGPLQNLDIDDRFVTTLNSSKRISPDADYHIHVTFEIDSVDSL